MPWQLPPINRPPSTADELSGTAFCRLLLGRVLFCPLAADACPWDFKLLRRLVPPSPWLRHCPQRSPSGKSHVARDTAHAISSP